MSRREIHPVTPKRWPDLVELFEQRGPRGGHRNSPAYGCWCMYWRDRSLPHGEPKKRALEALVRGGHEPGLLAYDGDAAVGWVAIAPREEYAALLRSPQYRPRDDDANVWSVVCFTIDRPSRRSGIAGELLDAAVAYACTHGAASVEAYPHVADARDYMGGMELFTTRGFRIVREANKRAVVRRDCAASSRTEKRRA